MGMDVPAGVESGSKKKTDPAASATIVARTLALVMLTAAAAFLGGIWFANSTDSPHDDDQFEIFWQSWDVLDREFYYELPEDEKLVRGALQGLLATTGDPYTFLAPPLRAEFDRQSTAGEFGGIGAYVNQNADGQLVITMPFNGFPAQNAGLQAGDIVLAIDGTAVTGLALDDAVGLLRGVIGSEVTLKVYRPAIGDEFIVEVQRARVELPTVYGTTYGDVGYLRLFSFNNRATARLEEEFSAMQDQGVQALILDLRGNPGGLLDQAIGISDLFLGEGLILTQRSRSSDTLEYRSTNGQMAESIPLAVLIDGGSASASEVVAGALSDRGRAVLIGQTSYGKGSVQHVYDLADGSQLHLTVALWFTPDETPIQGQGLAPGIVVETPENPQSDADPFVEAALEYFAEQGITTESE